MAKPPKIRPSPLVELAPGEDIAQMRLYAERYQWLRERAIKIQGSDIWYAGGYLDLRVDIGLGHRHENDVD